MQPTLIDDARAALATARRSLADDPTAAAAQARDILAADPGNASALRVLGAALRRLNQPAKAAQAEQEAFAASTRSATHHAASQALDAGQRDKAKAMIERLLAEDPLDVMAMILLGMAASDDDDFETAEPLLRNAVALAPDEPAPRLALAQFLHRSKRPALALAEIDQFAPEIAGIEVAVSLRAELYSALGRLDQELALLEPLHAASPDPSRYGLRIGHALRSLGRNDEAEAMYRSILAVIPNEGTSWWSLVNLKTVTFDERDLTAMKQALTLPDMAVQNHIRLNFALGKAEEDRGEPAAAFAYYAEGNRLRSTISHYKREPLTEWIDNVCKTLTPAFYAARADQGALADDPIFIVGMQRSGSTLVEQVLASHPMIEGTAELTDMPNLMRQLGETAARANQPTLRYLAGLPASRLRAMGDAYLSASRVHRVTDRPLFTDKMPNNWMYVGVIRLILPNARIVDVRRDPLACCFSNWKQLYARGLDHSNALDTMGHHYADYVRLMRHFDGAQPGKIHRIIYDDLVDDLEGGVRALLDYLGVPFDPACLDFHSTRRAVRTISAGQVRKPINRAGIEQWKPFDQWLGPLREALGDTLDDWRK